MTLYIIYFKGDVKKLQADKSDLENETSVKIIITFPDVTFYS